MSNVSVPPVRFTFASPAPEPANVAPANTSKLPEANCSAVALPPVVNVVTPLNVVPGVPPAFKRNALPEPTVSAPPTFANVKPPLPEPTSPPWVPVAANVPSLRSVPVPTVESTLEVFEPQQLDPDASVNVAPAWFVYCDPFRRSSTVVEPPPLPMLASPAPSTSTPDRTAVTPLLTARPTPPVAICTVSPALVPVTALELLVHARSSTLSV